RVPVRIRSRRPPLHALRWGWLRAERIRSRGPRRERTNLTVNPYLSVVVATRNDDHGGDPLERLQALIDTFAAQCRRTGLTAELIVVEWNPPGDRRRVSELLQVPADVPFPVRFVEVPNELHSRLLHSERLPLFQMIAKNVGIRRARGQYVVATNIDI